ncbi:MAG: methyltransferase domain-containing protein [Candidatus Nitronauta litoralis]|uniref:Methyltransferase domain-containing protein n=1 Tax=Candidatus Nitronauta litoralis TaxID=2705533 RepID=A0A7T0BV92_9BACT|nr:MAG: methyltransferase domain-containing protein [Candidatus Nitronauta litoralis]
MIRPRFNSVRRTVILIFTSLFCLSIALPVIASPSDQERWDSKYENEVYIFGTEPISFIRDNLKLLPKGKVLDIAMGEGRNGVYLAANGFEVEGIDISEVGLKKAHKLAAQNNTRIATRVVDLENAQLEKDKYDVVLCTYYMQRNLIPQMKAAVKKGGMVVFETYNEDYLKYRKFNPEWVLKHNELLELFKDFKIIRYQAFDDGTEAYSSIIAQRQ